MGPLLLLLATCLVSLTTETKNFFQCFSQKKTSPTNTSKQASTPAKEPELTHPALEALGIAPIPKQGRADISRVTTAMVTFRTHLERLTDAIIAVTVEPVVDLNVYYVSDGHREVWEHPLRKEHYVVNWEGNQDFEWQPEMPTGIPPLDVYHGNDLQPVWDYGTPENLEDYTTRKELWQRFLNFRYQTQRRNEIVRKEWAIRRQAEQLSRDTEISLVRMDAITQIGCDDEPEFTSLWKVKNGLFEDTLEIDALDYTSTLRVEGLPEDSHPQTEAHDVPSITAAYEHWVEEGEKDVVWLANLESL